MVKKILVDKYDLFVLSSLIHYLINLLYMCEIRFLLFILFMGCLCACGRVDLKSSKTLFSSVSEISEVEWSIEADSLARVEGIQCNDSVLLVFDFYSGKSYSFDNSYCFTGFPFQSKTKQLSNLLVIKHIIRQNIYFGEYNINFHNRCQFLAKVRK